MFDAIFKWMNGLKDYVKLPKQEQVKIISDILGEPIQNTNDTWVYWKTNKKNEVLYGFFGNSGVKLLIQNKKLAFSVVSDYNSTDEYIKKTSENYKTLDYVYKTYLPESKISINKIIKLIKIYE